MQPTHPSPDSKQMKPVPKSHLIAHRYSCKTCGEDYGKQGPFMREITTVKCLEMYKNKLKPNFR